MTIPLPLAYPRPCLLHLSIPPHPPRRHPEPLPCLSLRPVKPSQSCYTVSSGSGQKGEERRAGKGEEGDDRGQDEGGVVIPPPLSFLSPPPPLSSPIFPLSPSPSFSRFFPSLPSPSPSLSTELGEVCGECCSCFHERQLETLDNL